MSTFRPLFSVIIPTYNRGQKLLRAIESVLAQTFSDYDVWVIDDGSTDQTSQWIAPYLDRVHYLRQENAGVVSARNLGIEQSTGIFIALLDSDDRWTPNKLAVMARAVIAQPEAGLFYSQWEVVDPDGKRLWVDRSRPAIVNGYYSILMGNFIGASTAVIRRKSLEEAGLFDPALKLCVDWDLWVRIARHYPIHFVPQILAAIEYSTSDKITANTQRWLDAHDRVVEKAFQQDPEINPGIRRAVLANVAYIKGEICLQAGSQQEALELFRQAIKMHPWNLKPYIYWVLLSVPTVVGLLPLFIRRRLRLPLDSERTM